MTWRRRRRRAGTPKHPWSMARTVRAGAVACAERLLTLGAPAQAQPGRPLQAGHLRCHRLQAPWAHATRQGARASPLHSIRARTTYTEADSRVHGRRPLVMMLMPRACTWLLRRDTARRLRRCYLQALLLMLAIRYGSFED